MLRSRRTHALVVLALLATPLFLFEDRALAIQDSEDKVLFGPVGIAPGERALVNVYAIGNPDEIGNPNETPWDFRRTGVRPRAAQLIQQQTAAACARSDRVRRASRFRTRRTSRYPG